MKILIAVVTAALLSAATAYAQWGLFQDHAPAIVGCSNSLDFSQACNSQYVGLL